MMAQHTPHLPRHCSGTVDYVNGWRVEGAHHRKAQNGRPSAAIFLNPVQIGGTHITVLHRRGTSENRKPLQNRCNSKVKASLSVEGGFLSDTKYWCG
jgi:hypothetical protein